MDADCTNGKALGRPIVGVLGGGSEPLADDVAEPCRALGELIARRGWHLLTGGGRGVMTEVARAFTAVETRSGLALGILPGDADTGEPPPGYPNPLVELAIRTHLPARGEHGAAPESRNHLNVLSADALVALPGRAGTLSEVRLALRYRRPILAWTASSEEAPLARPTGVPKASGLGEVERWLDQELAVRR